MYTWFQNLNENGHKLFHFRGSVGADYRRTWLKYEFSSGRALAFEYRHGEVDDAGASSQFRLGLLFFTAYITFYLPTSWYFTKKCIATWENNKEFYLIDGREYGFYFHHWAFVWSFHKKPFESNSKDPWWMRQYIYLDNLVLGKPESIEDKITDISDVIFKMGGYEFLMNSIRWTRVRRFRRFIPYSIFNRHQLYVNMEIKHPPRFSGKGENSWDCGDDGIFGMSRCWPHDSPTWTNREAMAKLAVQMYVEDVLKSAKRYGGSSAERGINKESNFEYVGRPPVDNGDCQAMA